MKNFLKTTLMTLGFAVAAHGAVAGGDITAGETKANAAGCAACHGADGNSPAPNFPKLAGLGEKYLLKQLKDVQAWDLAPQDEKAMTGRAIVEMTGLLSNMTEQDLQDLAAFYDSQSMQLSGAKEMKVLVNQGIKVDALPLGQRVYRGGNLETGVAACTGCHSPSGKGNEPAGYPRLSGQHADYIEKQLKDFRAGRRINDGDPMTMRQVAEHMSDAEISAVAQYISGLH